MGYFKHNAIVVTGWKEEVVLDLQRYAFKQFEEQVSPVVISNTNSWYSFFISPDGSKEGWETSSNYDDKREEFFKYLKDNNIHVDAIDVRYGGDDDIATIEHTT